MSGYRAIRRRRLILASSGHRDQVRFVENYCDEARRRARLKRRHDRQVAV